VVLCIILYNSFLGFSSEEENSQVTGSKVFAVDIIQFNQRKYEFNAARNALVSSALIVNVIPESVSRRFTWVLGIVLPSSGDNDWDTIFRNGGISSIVIFACFILS